VRTKRMSFGRVQMQIMGVLWDMGRATAREVTDAMSKRRRISHSTVQTLLRQLESKGAVGHETRGRSFVFYPRASRQHVTDAATFELIDRVFGGSAASLVAHLVESEEVPAQEMAEIRRLVEESGEE
jgi:BlaI family penicillinase repressor